MILTYTDKSYRITYDAVSMVENALGNPNLIQISVIQGCTILVATNKYGITYLPNGDFQSWTLAGINTALTRVNAHYIYARLRRTDKEALIVFSVNNYAFDGKIIGITDSEPSEEFYYVSIGRITDTNSTDGATKKRELSYDGGYLNTPQGNEEETSGWQKLFVLTADNLISALKYFTSITVKGTLNIIGRLVFNEKEVTNIAREIDEEIAIDDTTLPTTQYLQGKNLEYLRRFFLNKDRPDKVKEQIEFLKNIIVGDLLQANGGLVVRKEEIIEEAFLSLTEEGEDSLIEELYVGDPITLGEVTNVDDDADKASDTDDLLVRLAGSSEWSVNSNLFTHVSQLMTKVFPFTMNLSGGGTYEKGSSQTVNLSWSYDRDIESQSINNESLAIGTRSKKYAEVVLDTTYTLRSVSNGENYSKSVSAQFKTKKYYGVSASESLTNAQILALSSSWAQRAQGSTAFDCTGGKYPYYILPTSLASGIQFWIGGLRNTDWTEEIREVTNAYGHTESYTIFRLNSIQTGVLNIEVK